jgi:AcrR family transcriptional regulator
LIEVPVPAALMSREEVVERLMKVVRQHGYDGASLAELSKATGLGRSSLYHYFPDGKDDMVRAVLDQLEQGLRTLIFEPLRGPGRPRRRLEHMLDAVDAYYRGGRDACVLGNLVLGTSRTRFQARLRSIFDQWTDAVAATLVDAGVSRAEAQALAEDAIVRMEGALIVAGGTRDPAVFTRTLKRIGADIITATGG